MSCPKWEIPDIGQGFEKSSIDFNNSIPIIVSSPLCYLLYDPAVIVVENKMYLLPDPLDHMMTSSNGNIFPVTGPLCGEFTGQR